MRIIKAVLIMLRVGLGLVGSVMVLQSILGVFAILDGAPWAIILYAAFNGLAGYLLTYGAFHHFPGERWPRLDAPAA